MESTGIPEKIQISEDFKKALETYYPEFNYTLRGTVEIKVGTATPYTPFFFE